MKNRLRVPVGVRRLSWYSLPMPSTALRGRYNPDW